MIYAEHLSNPQTLRAESDSNAWLSFSQNDLIWLGWVGSTGLASQRLYSDGSKRLIHLHVSDRSPAPRPSLLYLLFTCVCACAHDVICFNDNVFLMTSFMVVHECDL